MRPDRVHPAAGPALDVALALVVLAAGWWVVAGDDAARLGTAVAAAAAGVARIRPAIALAAIWTVALLLVLAEAPALGIAPGVVAVGYRCARFGSRPTVWLAGLSVPAGAGVAVGLALVSPDSLRTTAPVVAALRLGGTDAIGGFVGLALVLVGPYAVGLLVRVNERYRTSRVEQQRAADRAAAEHEIAQTRAIQTRLARDVHDVVGHSLAVIVAQADSARLDAQDESVRTALAQIADVGRTSLAEIRDVLTRTGDAPAAGGPDLSSPDASSPDPDDLLAGVRAAGNDVRESTSGTPRPLDPVTGAVVYRVLQEFLTNALKHGTPGGAIDVEREWTPGALVVRVRNPVTAHEASGEGMGLAGVRARLAGVDGTVRTGVVGGHFVATASLPA